MNGVRFLLKNGSFFAVVMEESVAKGMIRDFSTGKLQGTITGQDFAWTIRVEEIQAMHLCQVDQSQQQQMPPPRHGQLPFRTNQSGNY